MAATQKRMLAAPKGKISKIDPNELIVMLRAPGAWDILSEAQRRSLYEMLPLVDKDGQRLPIDQIDTSINPLNSALANPIERGIKRFHNDLCEGRREKKWVEQAAKASQARREGKFDDFLLAEREEYWGKNGITPADEANG